MITSTGERIKETRPFISQRFIKWIIHNGFITINKGGHIMEKTITLTSDEIQIITIALDDRIPTIQRYERMGAYPEHFANSLIEEIRALKNKLNY